MKLLCAKLLGLYSSTFHKPSTSSSEKMNNQHSDHQIDVVVDIGLNNATPLHTAASLGLTELTRDITHHNPELTLCADDRGGLTPLHVAAACGHAAVVQELLGMRGGGELCRVPDKNGRLPVHVAAANGRVGVLEAMVRDEGELFGCKDKEGNNVLHLAAARKQVETVKFLLDKPWIDVNATNYKGLTVLDLLLQSQSEHKDSALEDMIRAAGGRATPNQVIQNSSKNSNKCFYWTDQLRKHLSSSQESPLQEHDKRKDTRQTLMVVATLIATVTFQAGLNPPGGFSQASDVASDLQPGQALIDNQLGSFLICDMIAFVCSLSVILLMICGCTGWKYMIRVIMWMTWVAVFFTGLAFFVAMHLIFRKGSNVRSGRIIFSIWFLTIVAVIIYLALRLQFVLFRVVRSWSKKRRGLATEAIIGNPRRSSSSSRAIRLAIVIPLSIFAWGVLCMGLLSILSISSHLYGIRMRPAER